MIATGAERYALPQQRPPANLADLLQIRRQLQASTVACVYLDEREVVKARVTFETLDSQARAIAARLQGLGASGGSAILLYPPGMEFISAFFGCMYANVTAVPLPIPRAQGAINQFLGIVEELKSTILLTTAPTLVRAARSGVPIPDSMMCLATEETPEAMARAWRPVNVPGDAVAYLQYTSGSTANRKGVVVSHANVIANLRAIAERFDHQDNSVGVNWLPHTHDLGLVNGILQPIYHGHLNVLMSPTAFVQHPIRWLNAISRHRGTYSNSPNFGYDLCLRRTTPAQRASLDLSCWEVALNGAEPVRRQTIDDFVTMFSPHGFRRSAFFPAYGLAEATLMVSGGPRNGAAIAIEVDAAELEQHRVVERKADSGARTLVGCGRPLQSTTVAIVDPETRVARAEGEIGEIWVHGPGVAAGYWQRPDVTNQVFGAEIAGAGNQRYLRTGDLGFVRAGEVFITGRLKDLIIIRGANHYPQDIEWTVERCHPAFRPGCGAAFSVDSESGEELVVVFELERESLRSADYADLAQIAREAVAAEHDLHLRTLVLLKTGSIPRTTSGKIQRRQCRAEFLGNELSTVWTSEQGTRVADPPPVAVSAPDPDNVLAQSTGDRASELIEWLRDYADDRVNSRLMDERRLIAPHVILDFGNHGVLGLQAPAEYGGQNFGYVDALKVLEQVGAIDETLAMMTIVHNWLGIWPIQHHAAPALRAEWLPRLATGRELAAFAITEPAAGSHPQDIVTTAVPDGPDAWRLYGQKSWSGTAGWSSVINVFAQTVGDDGCAQAVTGFAVPRGAKGLRMGPEALTVGMRGMVQNTIYLEGVRVMRSQCLGEPANGMKVAQGAMMQGRLAIGAACVGGMKRSLQLLARYAERRQISTGRLVDNPVLLERVGAISAALAGVDGLVNSIAGRLDKGVEVPGDALIVCKVAGSEWLCRAADDLVQFLGGRGYVETNVATQLWRDARVTRILEGPSEALNMFLGSRVLNDGVALHEFLKGLGAGDVSARLEAVAQAIHTRCTSGQFRFGDGPADRRRWAYALIGHVATDAVLLAATPQTGPKHCRPWAEQRFEASIATALAQASAEGYRFSGDDFSRLAGEYRSSIGDIEQSLDGEDTSLDQMLRRAERPSARQDTPTSLVDAVVPETVAAVEPRPEPPTARPMIDAPAIEQFLIAEVASALKLQKSSIDPTRSLLYYGVDSVTTVMLAANLEDWLQLSINPEIVYNLPVIRQLAAELAEQHRSAAVLLGSADANLD
jgi:acyl-CoA synthetase (AMP-forming)/AMP-acid ligase II/alkylation response protein AidB-like acyl-CoA dehydrogenase/acyl carrier protein